MKEIRFNGRGRNLDSDKDKNTCALKKQYIVMWKNLINKVANL